jgi:thiol-disulfide isomerase/thioredoxin
MVNKTKGYVFVFVSLISLLSISLFKHLNQKEQVKNNVAKLPILQVKSITGKFYQVIPKDKPIVLFFFNSTCEHCQEEAKHVVENHQKLQSADVYFLSTENLQDIQNFAEKYQLHHFQVGQVKDEQVSVPMGIQTFPTCFVYSESGNFIKQFKGQVKMDVITDLF